MKTRVKPLTAGIAQCPTGIPGLDELTRGGLPQGTAEFPGVRVIIISLHDSASKAVSAAADSIRFIPKHERRREQPDAIAELFSTARRRAEELRA